MYLAASWESISAVLLVKKGKRQVPIYFVRQMLQGAELNYPELEKLILALAVELGEHDIEFRGHNPVKGPILADFLVETPSTESKEKEAKETTDEEEEPESMWKLCTDEASSTDGFGACLMLVNHEGKEYTYALLFKFDTTNNEADYSMEHVWRDQNKKVDALSNLASMNFSRLAKEVLVEVLHEKSIVQKEVVDIIKEEGESWMLPIQEYLLFGTLPKDL
ncbi:hypothetical protein Tco_0150179 [Tanacetum coccineum]